MSKANKIFQTIRMGRPPRSFAPVIRLFLGGRPITVFWRIITIVINTIKTTLKTWSFPHVFDKILKRINPFIANFNTSSTPSSIVRIFGIKASLLHRGPRFIFWCMSKPVRKIGWLSSLKRTSARLSSIPSSYHFLCPTNTNNFPVDRPFRAFVSVMKLQISEIALLFSSAISSWKYPHKEYYNFYQCGSQVVIYR